MAAVDRIIIDTALKVLRYTAATAEQRHLQFGRARKIKEKRTAVLKTDLRVRIESNHNSQIFTRS